MINRVLVALTLVVSTVLLALANAVHQGAQAGDQFLDGIGETGLIARYVLDGHAEDSSRNLFHAVLRGTGGTFVEDGPRRVLLLTGDGSHLQLPGNALAGEDTINGRDQSIKAVPGTYTTITRNWRANDTIELRMPFHFYLDSVMDQPNVASLFYGPVLLAAEESGPRTDWRQVTLAAADPGKSIAGNPATLRFSVDGVTLKPFYETYGRHSVYLHVTHAAR